MRVLQPIRAVYGAIAYNCNRSSVVSNKMTSISIDAWRFAGVFQSLDRLFCPQIRWKVKFAFLKAVCSMYF